MGCLGLFIVMVIIGWIANTFGDTAAFIVFIALVILSIWANIEEKRKNKTQATNTPSIEQNVSDSISLYNANKKTTEYKVAKSKPPINPPNPQSYYDLDLTTKSSTGKSSNKISFLYENLSGNITERVVRVDSVDRTYITGFCYSAKGTRTFKLERIIGLIEQNGESYLVDDWLDKQGISSHYDFNNGFNDKSINKRKLEICFTGFRRDVKEKLERKAIKKDFTVRKSVTKNLDFLVTGSNAGPAKMSQARLQGVIILNEDEFYEMMETGALPD